MADPKRLYGLKALVLNAADGVGEAIARTLVKHGATVIAADTKNSGVAQQFAMVKGVTGVVANLTDPESLSALVNETAGKLGGLDILVNDFLLRQEAPVAKVDEALEKILHLRAGLIMTICRAALPHLEKSPAGRIINVGFLRSFFAADGNDAARRAEQDLANLTRALAAEAAPNTDDHNLLASRASRLGDAALDAGSARLVKDVLVERVRDGATVIMTTHILEVAERMAERIGVISKGRLIAEGTLEELRRRAGKGDHSLEDIFLALVAEESEAA